MNDTARSLRGTAAVVGVAESDLGAVSPGLTSLDLVGQATARALGEAGLALSDVDALFTHSSFVQMPVVSTAQYLGIRPRLMDGTSIGGSSFIAHLHHAAAAIEAGLCEVALIVYGSVQRSASGKLMTSGAALDRSYETPYKPRFPVSSYALAAARHMHQYGTSLEQLAEVAVAARQWAQLNPVAFKRDPLTLQDVMESPIISSPLRVADCCLVTDGGGAVVVTSAARARDLRQEPIYFLGAGEAAGHMDISQARDLTVTSALESSTRAYAAAGLSPADVDVVQLYDAFTINTILFMEDLGFCAKGEGGAFVQDGAIAPGGRLAVNTNGGGLSYCHPGMYGIFTIIEAVRQLRGEAGARQIEAPSVGLVHGNGGTLSSQVTALLGTGATL